MSVEKLKDMIKEKSRNIITDKKAQEIIKEINKQIPFGSLEEKLIKVGKYSELPSWLNDSLTINETFFFRHADHFAFLEGWLSESKKENLKVLCGGVSSGEEAYSLALIIQEYFGDNFDISAVDISKEAIEKAKNGIYHKSLIDRAPKDYYALLTKYLLLKEGLNKDYFKVVDSIQNKVSFKVGNIFNFPLENYDIIFFRNILIYFDQPDKERIYDKLWNRLNKDGLMFVGGGELFPKKEINSMPAFKTSVLKKVA